MCVRSNKQEVTKEFVDVLKVFLPIPDSRMYRDAATKRKIRGELLPDGTGFVVIIPSMSTGMSEEKGIRQIHEGEDEKDDSAFTDVSCFVYLAISLLTSPSHTFLAIYDKKHLTKGSYFKKNMSVHNKKMTFLFPDGVTCNARHFNGSVDPNSLTLKMYLRLVGVQSQFKDDDGEPLVDMSSYVWWMFAVDGPFQSTDMADDEDSDDDVTSAYKRMSSMSLA